MHFYGGFSVVKEAHSRKMQENLHERDGSYGIMHTAKTTAIVLE